MTNHTHLCGPYTVTVWGRGTCLVLERDGLSLFWQGDEAAINLDLYNEYGLTGLNSIWDAYSSKETLQ